MLLSGGYPVMPSPGSLHVSALFSLFTRAFRADAACEEGARRLTVKIIANGGQPARKRTTGNDIRQLAPPVDEYTRSTDWRLTWIKKSKLALDDKLSRLGEADGNLTACNAVIA